MGAVGLRLHWCPHYRTHATSPGRPHVRDGWRKARPVSAHHARSGVGQDGELPHCSDTPAVAGNGPSRDDPTAAVWSRIFQSRPVSRQARRPGGTCPERWCQGLHSRTFDGFRRFVAQEFAEVYIVDLGGD